MTRTRHRVEVIVDAERLQAFEPAWQALFAADRRASPFQSPDWLLPWSESFVAQGGLRVIVLWDGARAVLCLPLRQVELGGRRRLAWLGEGLSDYLDVLAAPDADEPAFQAAWAALRELATDAEQLELSDLPEGSPLLRGGAGWSIHRGAVCPKLELDADAAAFERTLPPWLARNLQIGSWSDRAVAATYTLVRRPAYLYLTGFDPSIEGVSLGSLAIARVIHRAISAGRRTVHFLRGQEAYHLGRAR